MRREADFLSDKYRKGNLNFFNRAIQPKSPLKEPGIPKRVSEIFEKGLLKKKLPEGAGWKDSLYPPQKEALNSGIFSGKSLLLCTGTGSGKTLVAELASINTALSRKKVVYITPLRALSQEKHSEFKEKYGGTFKISLSIGGLDSEDGWLSGADIIFLTTEKLDALMRHRVDWLEDIGLLVADEIHEIGSSGRGPTLEMVIVKLRKLCPTLQILALSATVGNAKELAEWLDSGLVESDFRPVPLKEGTIAGKRIEFVLDKKNPGEVEEKTTALPGTEGAVLDCLEGKSQCIVFNPTRKSAQKTAEDLAELLEKKLPPRSEKEKQALEELSEKIRFALPIPTDQCVKLAECVKGGTAFHHAGLVSEQKTLVEDAFRKGLIRALSATVTLVAGMNLPARRIILKSMITWGGDGPRGWPVSLYKQACGRAGRPGLDSLGESIVIAKDERARLEIVEKYVLGETEEISSLLGSPPVLRKEILGAISSGFGSNLESLLSFFEETFYSHRNGGLGRVEGTILSVLEELSEWGFVNYSGKGKGEGAGTKGGFLELSKILSNSEKPRKGGEISLTPIGKRVAELYLDPLSAKEIIEGISKGVSGAFPLLVLVSSTTELMPGPSVRIAEEEKIWERVSREKDGLPKAPPEPWEPEAEIFARAVKLALALEAWINEAPDKEIMDSWGIAPGDLRGKLINSDWVCYSASELSKLSGKREETKELLKLQIRLEHGIKEELLDLIRLKGIGRVRARKLHSEGLKTASAVLNTRQEKLASLLGEKVAKAILSGN